MNFKHVTRLFCAAAMSLALTSGVHAQDKVVKIGVIMPMSGGTASIGAHAKAALDVATDIINNAHPELGNFPLAKNAGLAGLGGAKVEVIIADNQGNPATGQNQALRLITEEKVAAVFGSYQSGVTLTSSAIAEKYGIPFLNSESVAANLTERGFKWFFRTTPIATDFAKIYVDFLADIKAQGAKTDNVAVVHDNTEYGTSVANTIAAAFKEKGQPIALDVAYPVNATDLQGQVLQLKDKKPDVVIMISYTSDAILFAKTMQSLDYKPAVLLADDAGYSDPSFTKAVGKISQGVFNRSSWVVGPPGSPSAIIADMYKKKSGEEMDDTVAAADAGLLRAGRCHRPRRLDRACKDPGRAEGDGPQARAAHDRLQGREVRRQGPEHPGFRRHHPAPGWRELRRGMAEGQCREGAGTALQGLVRLPEGGTARPAFPRMF
ncbi:branched-chain amino acid transport system substrate-binding protein [Bradyrhizobium japonicum]